MQLARNRNRIAATSIAACNVKDPAKEFAILAYPSEYGASGIMTFIVNQEGAIYHKNLGVDTAKAVEGITSFAPDDTWTRET